MTGTRISKLLRQINILLIICFCSLSTQAKYGGGSGTSEDPYQIWDANHMQAIGADSNDWDKHFKLMADIDLSAYTGTQFNIIGKWIWYNDPNNEPFTGIFDGNGHTISNFTYDSTDEYRIGIFAFVGHWQNDGEIKNLGLVDPNLNAVTGMGVGSLVGSLDYGAITNCYSKGGSVRGDSGIGGLVGINIGFIADCCVIECSIEGNGVGGFVGRNYPRSTITNCYVTGSVTGDYYVGGLVGDAEGTITNCNTFAIVTGNLSVGGLVGESYATIIDCYSMGRVDGGDCIGGLVGYFEKGKIGHCYSTCNVTGYNFVGGLVGESRGGPIVHCYATNDVAGNDYVGGLVGLGGWLEHCFATGNVVGNDYIGGLVGSMLNPISNCYTTGNVVGRHQVGGLVGRGSGTTTKCYSTGIVDGNSYVGGLVGYNISDIISDCYSRSDVSGDGFIGGLVGIHGGEIIANCYSVGDVNGFFYVGGLMGYNGGDIDDSFWNIETSGKSNMCGFQTPISSGCDPNYGKTTAEMHQKSTFKDWNFINVWNIGENQTYPYLRTYLAGDINKDGIVNFKDFAFIALQWLEEYYFGNRPPRVLITYPEDAARLMVGGVPPQTMILAEANDYDGSVVRVEFFADDLKLGEDTDGSDGWSYLWQDYSLGFHVLTAIAWDNEGLSAMSTPVNVEVWMPDPPPP